MSRQEQALRLFEFTKPLFLISVGEDGLPDARAMASIKTDGLNTIWMITGKNSDKYQELSKNPNCMLYATDLEHTQNYLELRLWGKIDILDDAASKALIWRDEYFHYFPGGKDDPNLCVLKFKTESGTLQSMAGKENLTL